MADVSVVSQRSERRCSASRSPDSERTRPYAATIRCATLFVAAGSSLRAGLEKAQHHHWRATAPVLGSRVKPGRHGLRIVVALASLVVSHILLEESAKVARPDAEEYVAGLDAPQRARRALGPSRLAILKYAALSSL